MAVWFCDLLYQRQSLCINLKNAEITTQAMQNVVCMLHVYAIIISLHVLTLQNIASHKTPQRAVLFIFGVVSIRGKDWPVPNARGPYLNP